MKTIVLDLETTVEFLEDGTKDNSPFNPKNKIVSAHWREIVDGEIGAPTNHVYHHNEVTSPDSPEDLRTLLEGTDLLIAHNAKYDVLYLREAGFPIPPQVYCTMIGEYILARGQRTELSLEAIAEKRDVTRKKSDLVDTYFKQGIGFEAMPLSIVLEYAEADVLSCAEIYLHQQDRPTQTLVTVGCSPVYDLMNEMLLFLV
jgi:DNA polymerase III epsilon subunit-like protein